MLGWLLSYASLQRRRRCEMLVNLDSCLLLFWVLMFVPVLRASNTLKKLYGSSQKLAPQYQQMSQYYTQQCKALENVSKDIVFKDLDAELKITPPPLAVLQAFGPRAWAQDWIRALPRALCFFLITSNFVNVIQLSIVHPLSKWWDNGRKPRDLTTYELWAGWETFRSENGIKALTGTLRIV